MSTSFFDTIKFWRMFVLVCCVVAICLGVQGVSSIRYWALHYAGVEIPSSWYFFAIVPPLLIGIAVFAVPKLLFGSAVSWRGLVVVCLTLLFGGTQPLIYMVYNLDARSHAYLDSTRSPQHR